MTTAVAQPSGRRRTGRKEHSMDVDIILEPDLTPGQLVVDYDVSRWRVYVHTIDAGDPDAIRAHIRAVCRDVVEVVGP